MGKITVLGHKFEQHNHSYKTNIIWNWLDNQMYNQKHTHKTTSIN